MGCITYMIISYVKNKTFIFFHTLFFFICKIGSGYCQWIRPLLNSCNVSAKITA